MVYTAQVAKDRNDFITLIKSKKEVIVVDHNLLEQLTKEINEEMKVKKSGKRLKKIAPVMLVLWWNPIGWALSGVVLLGGVLGVNSSALKKYNLYSGKDVDNNEIITLLRKSRVDLKYDTIQYPEWIASIDYDHKNKKIKTKK